MDLNENDRIINLDVLKARLFDRISDAIDDDKIDAQTFVNIVILSNDFVKMVDKLGGWYND